MITNNHVLLRWILPQRSQKTSLDGVFIQKKALQYAKMNWVLDVTNPRKQSSILNVLEENKNQ